VSGPEVIEEPGVLAYRVRMVEAAVLELRASQESIAASLQQLVRLEERHAETRESLGRAFTTLSKQGDRIAAIERDLPTLKLITGWVVVLMLACCTAAGALVWRRATETAPAHRLQQPQAAAARPAGALWITRWRGSFRTGVASGGHAAAETHF
jgi:hypothetical protein